MAGKFDNALVDKDAQIAATKERQRAYKDQLGPEVKAEPVQVKVPPLPPEPIGDLPKGINFNTDNEKSRTAFSQALAQVMVIVTTLLAGVMSKEPLAMNDDEAIGIAVPAGIILMRIKTVQEAYAKYGQYLVSMNEYVLLLVAISTYVTRVRKDLDNEPVKRGSGTGPKQADPGRTAKQHQRLAGLVSLGRDA